MLERDRLAAVIAEHGRNRVHRPALRAGNVLCGVWIHAKYRAARAAIGAKVVESFELTAFTLPVTNRVLDEIKLRGLAEIGYREN
jgi:hypothetical protein